MLRARVVRAIPAAMRDTAQRAEDFGGLEFGVGHSVFGFAEIRRAE
jgi:hypothetical protein